MTNITFSSILTSMVTETYSTSEELVKLSFFSDIAKSIASCKTLNETLSEVMRQIGNVFAPVNWSLMLRNSVTGDLKFIIAEGRTSKNLIGKKIKKGQGIAGWIAEHQLPLIIEDVENDHRFDSTFDSESGFRTKSIIGAPLISRGKVYGVIELINKLEGDKFTPIDLKLLTTITDFAAIAIERAYYHAGLKKMANIDPLTEVYNRRYFQFYLTKEIERSKRSGEKLSLLFIDIDKFKSINDIYGHVAGDKVLQQTAAVLRESARSADLIFRYGGDEFIILLPGTAVEDAKLLEHRITENIRNKKALVRFNLGLSIGIHEASGESHDELLQFVDKKMYMKKLLRKEQEVDDLAANISSELEQSL